MANLQTHLVLIHQVYAGKNDPGGTRHFELLSRFVSREQAKATVITADSSYLDAKNLNLQGHFTTVEDQDGVQVLRTRTYKALHRNYVARVASFIGFMFTSVVVGLRAKNVNVVMGTTPPLFQAVSACALAMFKRVPFLLEVRDLWPDFAIDIGVLRNPALIWASRRLELFLYRRADHILVNSPAYCEHLMSKGVPTTKISFISNGVDVSMFDPMASGAEFREKYGVREKFLVVYAGAVGLANDIDLLLRAAHRLRDCPQVHFMVVGDGKERARLQAEAERQRLDNVTFTGAVPKNMMPTVVAAADVCVAILKNIKMFTTTYPNKVFDYMAGGRPTVLVIDGVIRKVLEDAGGGTFVPPGDDSAFARAVLTYAENPERAKQEGRNARSFVVQHFNREQQAHEFRELIESIANSQRK